ncbi:MAG: trigger factor [Leptospiraceae bacterium]|nr:trigger factor [Leptospiraceae bacterium]MBK7055639.1 trigger factor [Leptospiraceae bacterium]MBK9502221.1 trigger factor [Leptospiraceae bacterium]
MEYKVTINDDATAKLDLTYTPEDIEEAFKKAYIRASQKVKVNGFRQGKAPIEMVIKMLGDTVSDDAVTILLTDSINGLYPTLSFKAYKPPKIEIEKFERHSTLIAKATYETAPEIHLGKYKELEVEVYDVKITDEDIQPQLKDIQLKLSKTQAREADELSQDTDLVDIDIETKNESGESVQDSKNTQYYIGLNPKQKKLDAEIIGLKQGETKTFNYTYDSESSAELVGKTFTFTITVNSISKVILPELDDHLAQEWDETPTMEELKNKMKENLKKFADDKLHAHYSTHLISEVVKNASFSIPNSLIEEESHALYHQFSHDYNLDHMPMEKYAELVGSDLESIKSNFHNRAVDQIKFYLAIHEIAKQENQTVAPEEMEAVFSQLQLGEKEKSSRESKERIYRNIYENLISQKVYDFLLSNSNKQGNSEISISRASEILGGSKKDN